MGGTQRSVINKEMETRHEWRPTKIRDGLEASKDKGSVGGAQDQR